MSILPNLAAHLKNAPEVPDAPGSRERFLEQRERLVGVITQYDRAGLCVFALHGIVRGTACDKNGAPRCICGNPDCPPDTPHCACGDPKCSPGKHPAEKWKHLHRPRGNRGIQEMVWRHWPSRLVVGVKHGNFGLGMHLKASGIATVDTDPRNGGAAGFAELVSRYGALPRTFGVRTGGGGNHEHFLDPGCLPPCTAIQLASGVELLSGIHQAVLPPTLHKSGRRYEIVDRSSPVPMPQWLIDLAWKQYEAMSPEQRANATNGESGGANGGPHTPPATRVSGPALGSVQERARAYVATMPAAISEQKGHRTTFKVACRLVIGFDLAPSDAFPILAEYNARCEPPWSEAELWHKLNDADKQPGVRGRLLIDQEELDSLARDFDILRRRPEHATADTANRCAHVGTPGSAGGGAPTVPGIPPGSPQPGGDGAATWSPDLSDLSDLAVPATKEELAARAAWEAERTAPPSDWPLDSPARRQEGKFACHNPQVILTPDRRDRASRIDHVRCRQCPGCIAFKKWRHECNVRMRIHECAERMAKEIAKRAVEECAERELAKRLAEGMAEERAKRFVEAFIRAGEGDKQPATSFWAVVVPEWKYDKHARDKDGDFWDGNFMRIETPEHDQLVIGCGHRCTIPGARQITKDDAVSIAVTAVNCHPGYGSYVKYGKAWGFPKEKRREFPVWDGKRKIVIPGPPDEEGDHHIAELNGVTYKERTPNPRAQRFVKTTIYYHPRDWTRDEAEHYYDEQAKRYIFTVNELRASRKYLGEDEDEIGGNDGEDWKPPPSAEREQDCGRKEEFDLCI